MDDATERTAAREGALQTPPVAIPSGARPAKGHGLIRHIGRAVWTQGVVALVLAALLGPGAAFLAAGIWAAVTYVTTIYALIQLVHRYELTSAFERLAALDAAVRLGLVSAAYFAVLCSSMALAAGLLGRRGRRAFLLPGLVLIVPSAALFSLGARLTADVLALRYGVATTVLSALFLYALLDAVLLGALLVDTRPRRKTRGRAHKQTPGSVAATRTTPLVRFGASQPVVTQPVITQPLDASVGPIELVPPRAKLAAGSSGASGSVHAPKPPDGDDKQGDAGVQPLAGVGAQSPPSA